MWWNRSQKIRISSSSLDSRRFRSQNHFTLPSWFIFAVLNQVNEWVVMESERQKSDDSDEDDDGTGSGNFFEDSKPVQSEKEKAQRDLLLSIFEFLVRGTNCVAITLRTV
jgi:hypothetical protein